MNRAALIDQIKQAGAALEKLLAPTTIDARRA
jgi:hypothetical protein